uniref:Uncharacterized protein n=1 Tax=Arundo donax TaxID=35708 RepID=A0A0A8ZLZ0_ARUDO
MRRQAPPPGADSIQPRRRRGAPSTQPGRWRSSASGWPRTWRVGRVRRRARGPSWSGR